MFNQYQCSIFTNQIDWLDFLSLSITRLFISVRQQSSVAGDQNRSRSEIVAHFKNKICNVLITNIFSS